MQLYSAAVANANAQISLATLITLLICSKCVCRSIPMNSTNKIRSLRHSSHINCGIYTSHDNGIS